MAFTNTVVFISLSFLILAYLLYKPLPETVEEPWTYRIQGVSRDLFGIISLVVCKVSGWSHAETFRNLVAPLYPTIHHNYPELKVEDLKFEGVPVRIYTPKKLKGPAPCVVYLHGGGWVIYSVNTHDAVTTHLALGTDMIVVSVDYRLAPENPYPAPLDDCLKATKYVLQNGNRHGIDVNRVAIMGDSVGGNMATVIALRLAEEDRSSMPPLKLQVLICPLTQVLNFRTSSMRLYRNDPIFNQRLLSMFVTAYFQLEWNSKNFQALESNHHITSYVRRPFYSKYFKEELIPGYVRQNLVKETMDPFDDNVDENVAQKLDSFAVDPYVSPLVAEDLSKLPPAYIVVTEFDLLRDDGLLYADRLKRAAVKVELSYVKGQPHLLMTPIPFILGFEGREAEWAKIYVFLKQNL